MGLEEETLHSLWRVCKSYFPILCLFDCISPSFVQQYRVCLAVSAVKCSHMSLSKCLDRQRVQFEAILCATLVCMSAGKISDVLYRAYPIFSDTSVYA